MRERIIQRSSMTGYSVMKRRQSNEKGQGTVGMSERAENWRHESEQAVGRDRFLTSELGAKADFTGALPTAKVITRVRCMNHITCEDVGCTEAAEEGEM